MLELKYLPNKTTQTTLKWLIYPGCFSNNFWFLKKLDTNEPNFEMKPTLRVWPSCHVVMLMFLETKMWTTTKNEQKHWWTTPYTTQFLFVVVLLIRWCPCFPPHISIFTERHSLMILYKRTLFLSIEYLSHISRWSLYQSCTWL